MFVSHVVHIKPKKTTDWLYNIDPPAPRADGLRARGRELVANVAYSRYDCEYRDIHELAGEQHAIIETFYCASEKDAEALAKYFAKLAPGHEVLVMEVKAIVQAAVAEPTMASVSEKGIVPR
jgi:hypothetical protein